MDLTCPHDDELDELEVLARKVEEVSRAGVDRAWMAEDEAVLTRLGATRHRDGGTMAPVRNSSCCPSPVPELIG